MSFEHAWMHRVAQQVVPSLRPNDLHSNRDLSIQPSAVSDDEVNMVFTINAQDDTEPDTAMAFYHEVLKHVLRDADYRCAHGLCAILNWLLLPVHVSLELCSAVILSPCRVAMRNGFWPGQMIRKRRGLMQGVFGLELM